MKSDASVHRQKLLLLAFIAGLGALNRMDTILFFAPALAHLLAVQHRNWRGLVYTGTGFLPFLLWGIFSVFYYGFLFPNTAYAKLNVDISRADLFHQGALYYLNSLSLDAITLSITLLALGGAMVTQNTKIRLLALGMGLYLFYIFYIGGDFMSGRFFSATVLFSTVLLLHLSKRYGLREKSIFMGMVLLLGLLPIFSSVRPSFAGTSFLIPESEVVDPLSGIADERLYYSSNWLVNMGGRRGVPDSIWVDLGKQYREQGRVVRTVTATGMAGYFAGPDVHIVDKWAICDPLLSRIKSTDPNWRIGHFTRPPVDGYIETLQTGQNQIRDPGLARYYDKLKIVISGDIWSWERFKVIWEINTGQYDDLIPG
jgi:arabinofuranosyltransferase